ncbi:MAG: hypothetical protein ACYTEQ_25665 [Planctomycetota bacterium]|jgi:hypothetical protein
MTLPKKLSVFVPIVSVLLAVPGICRGAEEDCGCGFDSNCPYAVPPCYRVVFEDVQGCNPGEWNPNNGTWALTRYITEDCNDCIWLNCGSYGCHNAAVFVLYPDFNEVRVEDNEAEGFNCYGPFSSGANIDNLYEKEDCVRQAAFDGQVVLYEPVWDCNYCGNCNDLTIEVVRDPNKDPIYYGNEDCCPTGSGETCYVTMRLIDGGDPNYVVPEWKIEVPKSPSDPNWVEVTSCKLVDVNSYPEECSEGNSVTFTVQAKEGKPPEMARVTVTGSFFNPDGTTASRSEVVNVRWNCDKCCSCGSGAGGGLGGGGFGGGGCAGGVCAMAGPMAGGAAGGGAGGGGACWCPAGKTVP